MVSIAISGPHGAGKTTAAKALAKRFGLKYISAGEVFRRMAEERGMTIDDLSRHAESHPEIDRKIDLRTADASRGDDVVIDARLAGWMAKGADIKILLTSPLEVRVKRIAERERRRNEDVLVETKRRERSEARRFKRFYSIDVNDHSVFDLVLNTESFSSGQMTELLGLVVSFLIGRKKGH